MRDLRPALYLTGFMLLFEAGFMLLPFFAGFVSTGAGDSGFLAAAIAAAIVAGSLIFATRQNVLTLSVREAFMFTSLSWIALAAFAALPFYLALPGLSYTDAFFEAISGLTTTGATILTGLDSMPADLLLWRALLQWLGGIGIIVTALAVLPMLQVGGMQLFRAESSDNSEKILPRAREIAFYIAFIYLFFSTACAALYFAFGMSAFDAAAHAMTTIATGGFSTRDQSFAAFDAPALEAVAIVFMLIGSLPFVLYLQTVTGRAQTFTRDEQLRWLFIIAALTSAVLALTLYGQTGNSWGAIRHGLFNGVSILTGTGYASADFSLWAPLALALLFVIMFAGGCAGSTACGAKIFRLIIAWRLVRGMIRQMARPHALTPLRYNGLPVPDSAASAVMNFLFLYAASWLAGSALLHLAGLDALTAFSAAAASLANVGPGLGHIIGPGGSYAPLSDAAKWLLCLLMLAGRLELFTLFVLVAPSFWRR